MDPQGRGYENHSETPEKKHTQVYEFKHASVFIKHDNRRAETECDDEDADADIPHHNKRRTIRATRKSSSPVYAYTYEVS